MQTNVYVVCQLKLHRPRISLHKTNNHVYLNAFFICCVYDQLARCALEMNRAFVFVYVRMSGLVCTQLYIAVVYN